MFYNQSIDTLVPSYDIPPDHSLQTTEVSPASPPGADCCKTLFPMLQLVQCQQFGNVSVFPRPTRRGSLDHRHQTGARHHPSPWRVPTHSGNHFLGIIFGLWNYWNTILRKKLSDFKKVFDLFYEMTVSHVTAQNQSSAGWQSNILFLYSFY